MKNRSRLCAHGIGWPGLAQPLGREPARCTSSPSISEAPHGTASRRVPTRSLHYRETCTLKARCCQKPPHDGKCSQPQNEVESRGLKKANVWCHHHGWTAFTGRPQQRHLAFTQKRLQTSGQQIHHRKPRFMRFLSKASVLVLQRIFRILKATTSCFGEQTAARGQWHVW